MTPSAIKSASRNAPAFADSRGRRCGSDLTWSTVTGSARAQASVKRGASSLSSVNDNQRLL